MSMQKNRKNVFTIFILNIKTGESTCTKVKHKLIKHSSMIKRKPVENLYVFAMFMDIWKMSSQSNMIENCALKDS